MSSNILQTDHTCPWWLIFLFDNPLRKRVEDPVKMLSPFVRAGDTALDVGCGMGYFSLGLARLVGESGKVIAADLQPQMLAGLTRRAQTAGLGQRIQTHLCQPDKIGLSQPVDFALAFWMVHEVQQRGAFLQEVYGLLKPGGKFLVVEPLLHVSAADFALTLEMCEAVGFQLLERPGVAISRAVCWQKPG